MRRAPSSGAAAAPPPGTRPRHRCAILVGTGPEMTLGELTQAMSGREGDRVLMAKAEMLRRQTQAQLDACAAQQRACASLERNASFMLYCAIASAVSAFAIAVAMGIALYTFFS
jgi:hypothetical protein